MLRRPVPPPPRLAPFRLHYPTHAGNSSIPPPYEMAFPPPKPPRRTSPLVTTLVVLTSASAVILGGLYGVRRLANAHAQDEKRVLMRNERIAETHALLSNVRERFPVGLTDERACANIDARTPLLSFAQLGAGTMSAGEAAVAPTSFVVTKDTALDAPVVAVLMTTDASVERGVYDGWIVVFDRRAKPLCQARVQARSETSLGDLRAHVRGAERAAASRLSPRLTLDF